MIPRPLDELAQLEAEIRKGRPADNFHAARKLLREWLSEQGGLVVEGSIGDTISALASSSQPVPHAAAVILRCLAVQDLIPTGVGNANTRSIVDCVERNLPAFFEFFGIERKAQTFEKFQKLEGVHHWVCSQLTPMSATYIGLESVVAARSAVVSGLNHRIVKQYCDVFRLPELRGVIENVISRLKKVSEENPSLLIDVEEARKSIEEGLGVGSENGSFLYLEYGLPFLRSAEAALEAFVESVRSKFTTTITRVSAAGVELQKRYPLHQASREIEIRFPLRNVGPGMATSVRVSIASDSEHVLFASHEMHLGNVLPGDFSVSVDAMVMEPCNGADTLLSVQWGEIGSPRRDEAIFEFKIVAQRPDINWGELEYSNPYSTEPAEGEQFVGRTELVRNLSSKTLRSPMEPFYITGQKRVGKTSLAFACLDAASEKSVDYDVEYKYILWGAIANEDARASMRELGLAMERFITNHLPSGVVFEDADYTGSLSPIVRLAELSKNVIPRKKFVFIIDEFDEIHQELYLQGNLAETFFANIRAIAATKSISLVLVGGENMPFIMERQGQKLNKFTRTNLSYFSRDVEWEDYKVLVRKPVEKNISWHDDAIAELFNVTNGNPYFTNILASGVLRNAVEERDADITQREVRDAIGLAISNLDTNSFIHLWQDGIFKPINEREPEVLRRGRVLVAIARCLRARVPLTLARISEHKGSALLGDNEIAPVLHDFVRRDVLYESGGVFKFRLPLFEAWLEDAGVAALVADALSEELASAVESEEEAARVRSEEIVTLSKRWPTFRGQHVTPEDVRAWLEQVETNRKQRVLFKLLNHLRFFGEGDIRDRLRTIHSSIRKVLPEFVMKAIGDKRRDVLISYVDGEGKSGQYYASTYAEENRIPVDCIIPPSSFEFSVRKHIEKYGRPAILVIVDDIAGTGNGLASHVEDFVDRNRAALDSLGCKIVVAALVATPKAIREIENRLSKIANIAIELRVGETLGAEAFAFHSDSKLWGSDEERDRAKALCQDLGANLVRRNPLGYGDLGLLVVFPSTTPNNSLPILHAAGKSNDGRGWRPIFPRITN